MRLLSRLDEERKSGAIWTVIFRQSPEPDDPTVSTRGCDASGAATVAAGHKVSAIVKNAPANPSSGWIRVAECR